MNAALQILKDNNKQLDTLVKDYKYLHRETELILEDVRNSFWDLHKDVTIDVLLTSFQRYRYFNGISVRSKNALAKAGIESIGDIHDRLVNDPTSIYKIRDFGKRGGQDLRVAINNLSGVPLL